MIGYADPEHLIGDWLHGALGGKTKVWKDPGFPSNWPFTSPLVKLQRGQGFGALALSLDDVTLDVDTYAAVADHAREISNRVCALMEFQLPMTTFDNGLLVKRCEVQTRPMWTPDPKSRRSAAYRVILHGFVT